jgi:preprotein translocase subunit SecE
MAQKQGSDQPRRPEKRTPAPAQTSERTSPRQFLSEVQAELRKVAWPTRSEVINSTIIVLIAVVFMTSLIFAADYLFAKGVLFLYE